MKKLISLTLVLCLLLCLSACGGDRDKNPFATTEAAKQTADILGTINAQSYRNEFFGFQTTLPTGWEVYSFEQTAQLMLDKTLDAEGLKQNLEDTGLTYPFYATKDGGVSSVNIVIEKLNPASLSEQAYAQIAVKSVPAALESIGMSNVSAQVTSITFAGGSHAAVEVYGEISGTPFYETVACVKSDAYICCITVGSFDSATVQSLLASFTHA